ncbi:hypothetical protein [Sorangium sp. So ce117]|uniref:hypothetical protein n=1 Tax=Sorangium sp. So ce117 TaxID=3133277 RepID=UPI003F63DE71
MAIDFRDFAMLVSLDAQGRLVDRFELVIPLETTRSCFSRPPDFEGGSVVSWGALTPEEAEDLVAHDADPEHRSETLDLVRELFAAGASTRVSLYYADSNHAYRP